MHKIETIHRGIVQLIRWLAPASCLLCRRQHNKARAICADREVAFSRNQRACRRCAPPLQSSHSTMVRRLDLALISTRGLCPRCVKHPPYFFGTHAPYLMRTGMRDLIHLWKFQNRAQLTGRLAELLISRLPTASAQSLTYVGASAHTVLVHIPTQWRRQVRRGFDPTWLLANAIRSQWGQPAMVRPWLRNHNYRAAQHRLNKKAASLTRMIDSSPTHNRRP